ncbi:MAG: hypothetical protein M0Q95_15270 [Porticoccaceae bacterium]|nr:hypothetical protein [Porticoccaceae bacterium]
MDIELIIYEIGTLGVSSRAINEMILSQLPGRENGPADAYRHILLSAELTRTLGETYARIILEAHEQTGNLQGQTPEAEEMDRYNNELGIEIGNQLRSNPDSSWRDVVESARERIDPDFPEAPINYRAQWLPDDQWRTNPIDELTGDRMDNNDPRLNWPPEWPEGPYDDIHEDDPNECTPEDTDDDGIPDIIDYDIDRLVDELLSDARDWLPRRDPLTLDLDGEGIETLPANGMVLFDHDGDGIKNGTGWIAPDDGLLVLDKNGNGLIDNGNELFGDNTIKSDGSLALNGFDALVDLDSNNDGVIDSNDAQFNNLRVWQDGNSDGISQAHELKTLAAAGVVAIHLENQAMVEDVGNGNVTNSVGTFERSDGSESTIQSAAASLDLAANNYTESSMIRLHLAVIHNFYHEGKHQKLGVRQYG